MDESIFQRFDKQHVTDDMLVEAAKLFSEHYGVWGKQPGNGAPCPKPGKSECDAWAPSD